MGSSRPNPVVREATLDSLDETYGQSITTVSIAHRLTSIVSSDAIYVLQAWGVEEVKPQTPAVLLLEGFFSSL